MQSFAAVSQVMGGLFFGQSADRFGTRWALLTAHTAAMSGWAKADISWEARRRFSEFDNPSFRGYFHDVFL
jgi:hypothetical protein